MRSACGTRLLSALALISVAGCATGGGGRFSGLDNRQFYDAGGHFDLEAAKGVYLRFLKKAGYPVNDAFVQKLFVTDFGLGRFPSAGAGVMVWWGDEKHGFSGLDAFLLPGQIIPEHWHVKVRDSPEKMEAWLVRYGEMYAGSEGAPTPDPKAKFSAADAAHITVKHERVLGVGEIAGLSRPIEKHWLQAGPEGGIFTEFCTFHTGEAVRFTDPKVKF